jgi:hypothetical protein
MMRNYVKMTGYAMATHAHAESSSFLFGRTVITIDYSDYKFRLRPATATPITPRMDTSSISR